MLLGISFDFLQMLIVAILSQPADDIAVRPIDLQRVGMLIIDVILVSDQRRKRRKNHKNGFTSMGIWST
jgi:hypothetical protein